MILDDGIIMTSTDTNFCPPFRKRSMSATKPTRPKTFYEFSARKQLNKSLNERSFDTENFDLQPILDRSYLIRNKAGGSFIQEKEGNLHLTLGNAQNG